MPDPRSHSLILPGDPLFEETLGFSLPPGEPSPFYVARGEAQILEPASEKDLEEFVLSGEWQFWQDVCSPQAEGGEIVF